MGNLVFQERFNGDLSAWTLDQTGGTITIVTVNQSTKMRLNDTSGSGIVSAKRAFTAPTTAWIFESDLYYAASAVGIIEFLNASDAVLITVDCGSTANVCSFSTNATGASTATFNSAIYKQVILVIDPVALTAKCWISEDTDNSGFSADYGSLLQIGGAKAYTGTIASVRFKTGVSQTGIAYVDEVRAYTPDIIMIGDSITDGKMYWSNHPNSTYRLAAKEDETSSPSYQLAGLLGSNSTDWVANRAFGGSTTAQIDSYIQTAVLDHKPARVFVAAGHNDIVTGGTLSAMQTSMNSIIGKIQAAGITGANIIIGNVPPGADINTAVERSILHAWNRWLLYKAASIGALHTELHGRLKSASDENAITTAYVDATDNVHLSVAGNGVFADAVYDAIQATAYTGKNILRGAYGASDERLFPQGSYTVAGGKTPLHLLINRAV